MAQVVLMWSEAHAAYARKLNAWEQPEGGRATRPRVRDSCVICDAATGDVYDTHGQCESADDFTWPDKQVQAMLDAVDVIIFEALTGPSEIMIQANYRALSDDKRAHVDAAAAAYFEPRAVTPTAASSPVLPGGERGYPKAAGVHLRC